MVKLHSALIAFLIAAPLSAGALAAQSESFETFFERVQRDPAFRASRVAPGFDLKEELAWERTGQRASRTVPCGYQEAEANGWTILPDSSVLAGTGIAYAPPDLDGPDSATVSLGPAEGRADAEHSFERRGGKWYHTATLVFTSLQPGDDPPAMPCGTAKRGPGISSRHNTAAAGDATGTPSCASAAIARAKPLLALHFGEDDRISIADQASELPSIRNPANPKQRFRVFEVWGFIYKGEYRMRFIYHASPVSGCVLMGQEILEYARL